MNTDIYQDTEELCEVTQRQLAELQQHEDFLQSSTSIGQVTDLRTPNGQAIHVKDVQPDSIVTIDGTSGRVQDMIEAGVLDESIYTDGTTGTTSSEPEVHAEDNYQSDALTTVGQVEEALGTASTIESVTAVLAGESLSPEALEELCEAYGVEPDVVQRELEEATDELYNDFADYAEAELGVTDFDHLHQWVEYAVNTDIKVKQLYQQAVTGALNGDLTYSHDLVQAYRKFYRI